MKTVIRFSTGKIRILFHRFTSGKSLYVWHRVKYLDKKAILNKLCKLINEQLDKISFHTHFNIHDLDQ